MLILRSPGTKLSEDCCRYGSENINDEILSKAASIYGDAHRHVEKEQEDFNRLLFSQVGLSLLYLLFPLNVSIESFFFSM